MPQLNLEDYSRLQRKSVRDVRLSNARELCEQAEDLLRTSEHLTFDSALALLERLRHEEPGNCGARQQVSEEMAKAVTTRP